MKRMKPCLLISFCLLVVSSRQRTVYSFLSSSRTKRFATVKNNNNNNNKDGNFLDIGGGGGPEKSSMAGFIRNYLDNRAVNNNKKKKNADDNNNNRRTPNESNDDNTNEASAPQFTHMIGIPLDTCHELLLELESVQRAILYHCPVLVHSCIAPSIIRLPLLYVSAAANVPDASTILHRVVQTVVKEHTFSSAAAAESKDVSNVDAEDKSEEDGASSSCTANEDGIEPWLLSFEGLNVDGTNNQVLYTTVEKQTSDDPNIDSGRSKLQAFVRDLQRTIETKLGWKTALYASTSSLGDDDSVDFQPRVPFMRLPGNWEEILRKEHVNRTDDEDWMFLLKSDQGGNGISPIFWAQWMEDAFGEATRMREVAVYRRQGNHAIETERAFYLPEMTVPLPAGNAALTAKERKAQAYEDERVRAAEKAWKEERSGEAEKSSKVDESDMTMTKTRDRLEKLYSSSSPPLDEAVMEEKVMASEASKPAGNTKILDDGNRPTEAGDPLDDWTRQRIQNAVASRARVQSLTELARKKDKPPVEENPIFKKYKDGTLVPKQPTAPVKEAVPLPPFPSREYCTGFWRMLQSPTGFAVEEGAADRSDNLILRVDGTTAGGPILDQETRQKAAAGTWRLLDDNGTLRIRLVIPPKKERILVMQGVMEKVSMSSLPLASSTFGVPLLEDRRLSSKSELEDVFYCSGNVWIEDASTARNRDEIGKFSIMKLNVPTDPTQYTITIPRPVRNQD